MTNITLKPGDYVRTEGMTEEQYHAVAKAFMAAGCPENARPLTKDTFRTSRYVGWGYIAGEGETFAHTNTTGGLRLDGRQLTIDQILGTEPDADGWIKWHGGECPVEKGALVDVRYRDGVEAMAMPALTHNLNRKDLRVCVHWEHSNSPSDISAYRLHQPKQEEASVTVEQLLTKANKHAAKAAKHEAKRQALIDQARELLPEGWRLEQDHSEDVTQFKAKGPKEKLNCSSADLDMTDPANWKVGDVVECVRGRSFLTSGNCYALRPTVSGATYDEDKDVRVINDDGDEIRYKARFFKWISRPQ